METGIIEALNGIAGAIRQFSWVLALEGLAIVIAIVALVRGSEPWKRK